MKLRRFKVDSLDESRITVTGSEARHALKVLRLGIGDQVVLFDGTGGEAHGAICMCGDDAFTVEIHDRRVGSRTDGPSLTLAVATPKGERADWMIEKCAELGVSRLVPMQCERSQVTPGDGKIERWHRKAKEAAKQSGASALMAILPPMTIKEVCADPGTLRMFFADPGPEHPTLSSALAELKNAPSASATLRPAPSDAAQPSRDMPAQADCIVFIGPEGGFTPAERALLTARGATPVRLATPTLRIETAAVAAASIWAEWSCRA